MRGQIQYEGIIMFVLMAIIIIFLVFAFAGFFTPVNSQHYYNEINSMISQACYSTQSASSIQLNNPKAVVFQIYDNPVCNTTLSSSHAFQNSSPYNSKLLSRNFDLCYGELGKSDTFGAYSTKVSGPAQYYLTAGSAPLTYLSVVTPDSNLGQPTPTTVSSSSSELSEYGLAAASVDQTGPAPTFNSYQIDWNDPIYAKNNYVYTLYAYSNVSGLLGVTISESGCNIAPFAIQLAAGHIKISTLNLGCNSTGTIYTNFPYGGMNGKYVPVKLQENMSAQKHELPNYYQNTLAQQCSNLVTDINNNAIENGTLVCAPINCGSNNANFVLSDEQSRPLLAMFQESFPYFAVSSGLFSSLAITNPNVEVEKNESLV
jgi:Tfp pilus assembly protein FimT